MTSPPTASEVRSSEVKTCCASLYESDLARALLGDSFHPGGERLTARLGELLQLGPHTRVLDVASGNGNSAILLALHFGCEVTGIDFGAANVRAAAEKAAGLPGVTFVEGDAERLDFADATFDAIVCECAFCTFPDKRAAASEFARVLRPGGRVGISDLTRAAALPAELEGLLAWIACIGDARPVDEYVGYLTAAGFDVTTVEPHNAALAEMARDVQGRLLGLELMTGLRQLKIPGADLQQAKTFARAASTAIAQGLLGYSVIVGRRPSAEDR